MYKYIIYFPPLFQYHRKRFFRRAGAKAMYRIGLRANKPPLCSLLTTVKCNIGCSTSRVLYLAIFSIVCHLFILACRAI